MRPNDEKLTAYQRGFQTLPHPPGTERLQTFGKVGWMTFPFREECDFVVGEQRSYAGSQSEIKEFYTSYRLTVISEPPYFKVTEPNENISDLRLFFSDHKFFTQPCVDLEMDWPLAYVCRWVKKNNVPDSYVIFYTVRRHPPGYDPRCYQQGGY